MECIPYFLDLIVFFLIVKDHPIAVNKPLLVVATVMICGEDIV